MVNYILQVVEYSLFSVLYLSKSALPPGPVYTRFTGPYCGKLHIAGSWIQSICSVFFHQYLVSQSEYVCLSTSIHNRFLMSKAQHITEFDGDDVSCRVCEDKSSYFMSVSFIWLLCYF